ncbi:plakophilin-2 [Archocentrus centrarchus]|uniref:plakophilin-2 n=1 Tax=Archocentrus centrarchus TaxID=63155 RepID=UPI0011E9DF45|nr:plakophilin-2 [Archocentrus centrarchus]
MDEVFFKSALPAHESFVFDDTSLALPTDLRSSTQPDSKDRSLRVHRQIQLSLSRKAKKSLSNGGVYSQKNKAKSFDAADGFFTSTKVNRSTFSSHSFSSDHERKPSKREEVSPQASGELPRGRFQYSTYHYGMSTPPGPSLSRIVGTLPQHSARSASFHRSAFSEMPRGTQTFVSTPARATIWQRPVRQSVAPKSAFARSTPVQQNSEFGFWSYKQNTAKQENPTVQRPNGDPTLGSIQPDEGLSWLAQVRKRSNQKSLKQKSSLPSVSSAEVDAGRQVEKQLPIQQLQRQNVTTLKSASKPPEMTLERAVNLLTHNEEETLIYAASYIQNQCFESAKAREKVKILSGIGKLLQLLNNDSEEVQHVAAGALRNVVYLKDEIKMVVMENEGVPFILSALNSSRDRETRRQLTGLLWNLSSHDDLKKHLAKRGLSVLTRSVLVPGSGVSEGENPKDELLADAEGFYNVTGCLRNLSSAGPGVRKAMRECENLIDSLVHYIRGTVADRTMDDKSTENCVSILHNLSYQIESELPQKCAQVPRESRQDLDTEPKTYGCFSYRSAKITEHTEHQLPLLEKNTNPHGIEWLWSPITVRMYMSLVACSTCDFTKFAAVGALHNITAGNGAISKALAFTIVLEEYGLLQIKKMLKSEQSGLEKAAVFLIKNLSRNHELHLPIANQVLPEVVKMLPNSDTSTDSEMTTSLCQILTYLSQNHLENVEKIIKLKCLQRIINISKTENGASQAACILLHAIWKHTELHGTLRKNGFKRSDFVNARITKAVNSK